MLKTSKLLIQGLVPMLVTGAMTLTGAELTVGPGKSFSRIEEAVAVAKPGDSILVFPRPDNKPYEKTAVYVTVPRLSIKAANDVKKPIPLDGRGYGYSGSGRIPRAIVQLNKGADDCVIEGFELSGAHNESHNGAGIRINQANRVTVLNCIIHHNDMGIMSNGDGTPQSAVDQQIQGCLIHSNGDLSEPGFNHNLYLGGSSVTLTACEIHSSITGHNVKSRAHRTNVIACYIHDSANRELDLVDAKGDTTVPESHAVLAGNIIVKSPRCAGNRGVIHFGQDGGNARNGTLFMVNNTIRTPFVSPVIQLSSEQASASLFNNVIWSGGVHQREQKLADASKTMLGRKAVSGANNWMSAGFGTSAAEFPEFRNSFIQPHEEKGPFADPDKGDYHLARNDPDFADKGAVLPKEIADILGGSLRQYVAPLRSDVRSFNGKPDLGAYEWQVR